MVGSRLPTVRPGVLVAERDEAADPLLDAVVEHAGEDQV
jgi:hypothetical protein